VVGREVWRHDVNQDRLGGPRRVVVTKVGRKLVTIEDKGRPEAFRIDTGRANDAYGHGWLCTDEQHAEHEARSAVMDRLHALKLQFAFGGHDRRYSVETLAAVADLLENAPAAEADQ
jgi:hypothetical protein